MRRYLAILIALTMILTLPLLVHGEEKALPTAMKLNLEQANKLMEANNLEIKLLDKKIEIAETEYEDTAEDAEEAKSKNLEAKMEGDPITLQMKKTELLTYKLEWLQITSLRNDRDEKLQSLKSDIKDQFLNLQLLQEDMSYVKEDITTLDKKLQEVQLRIKLGQAKDSEYKSLYSQKLSLQNQLNLINTQYEGAMINLKKLIGVNLSQPLEIEKIALPYQVVNRDTLKADMLKSIENNFAIVKQNKEIEYKNQEIQLVKQYTDYQLSSDYKDLLIELSEMEMQLAYDKLKLEAELWMEYYNILVLEDSIKLQEVNLEIEKINYDSIMAKSKLGMINIVTELNAKTTYNRQKTAYQRAMYDYIMAVERFNENLK